MNLFKRNNEIPEVENSIREIQQTYEEYGYGCCVNHSGDISSYRLHLSTIFSGHIISEKDKKEDHSEKIKPILDNIRRAEQEIEDLDIKRNEVIPGKIDLLDESISNEKEEIKTLELNPPSKSENFSFFKYVSLSVFLILLTLSISYFYANIAWVLFSVKDTLTSAQKYCSPKIFNSISELIGKGDCYVSAGIGSIILPIIFLSFAYILHMIYSQKSKSKWFGMIGLGIAIIITDVVLAVEFEMKLKIMNGNFGIYDSPPTKFFDKLSLVSNGGEFVLILIFGFVSYILWAICLHHFEIEKDLKNPLNEHRRKIDLKKKIIEEIQLDKRNCKEELNNIPQLIQNIQKDISNLNSEISIAKIGGLQKLQKRIDEFTLGWKEFMQALHKNNSEKLASEQLLIDVEKNKMMSERTLKKV